MTSNVFFGLVVDPATDATVLISVDPLATPSTEMFKYVLPCSARIGAIPGSELSTAKIDITVPKDLGAYEITANLQVMPHLNVYAGHGQAHPHAVPPLQRRGHLGERRVRERQAFQARSLHPLPHD
mgnify:CR=1 FL=1